MVYIVTARPYRFKPNLDCVVKAIPLHAAKALGRRGYIAPTHSRPRHKRADWSASRPGRALVPWKGPPIPIGQEAGWAAEPVWTQRLEENSFRLCRGSNLDRPVRSHTILTELPVSLGVRRIYKYFVKRDFLKCLIL
jgi:hypothetical protein